MAYPIVIFVDDERSQLALLEQAFADEDIQVLTATSGKEALRMMEVVEVATVVSDQKMPVMSGTEFLAHVQEQFPDAIRIILTGHATMDMVLQATNHGKMYGFLTKPCNYNELRIMVRRGLEHRQLVLENRAYQKDLERRVEKRTSELEAVNNQLQQKVVELERMNARLTGMNELLGSMSVYHPLEEVLDEIARVAARVLPCDEVNISLTDSDVENHAPYPCIEVPLKLWDGNAGALQACNSQSVKGFEPGDTEFLKGLGGMIVVAVRDAAMLQDDPEKMYQAISLAVRELEETQESLE